MNPDNVPYKGPNKGAVRLLSKMLENVIDAGVPRTGYAGMTVTAKRRAVQIVIRARSLVVIFKFSKPSV